LAPAGALAVTQVAGDTHGQAVRGCGLVRSKPGLFQQYRHGFGFGAAVGGGNRGAQDRLRQDGFGKFQKRLAGRLAVEFWVLIVSVEVAVLAQLSGAVELLEEIKDGLPDQPLRRAIKPASGCGESLASRIIEPDAKCGDAHGGCPLWS